MLHSSYPSTASAAWSGRRWLAGSRWASTAQGRRSWPTGLRWKSRKDSRFAVGTVCWSPNSKATGSVLDGLRVSTDGQTNGKFCWDMWGDVLEIRVGGDERRQFIVEFGNTKAFSHHCLWHHSLQLWSIGTTVRSVFSWIALCSWILHFFMERKTTLTRVTWCFYVLIVVDVLMLSYLSLQGL